MTARDTYRVIGNPIEHSRSPQIHQAFAAQFGHEISYERLLAPLDAFEDTVKRFRDSGGCGANVTVPFKEQAIAIADQVSDGARIAGAANTLSFVDGQIHADNTDGPGLVQDLAQRHQMSLAGASIVIVGAGGAARGVVLPLAQASVESILIVNRTFERARSLVMSLAPHLQSTGVLIGCCTLDQLKDRHANLNAPLWINATAAGLNSEHSPIDSALLRGSSLAYDMMYASTATPFMRAAEQADCPLVVDGLGMLVEQAACSYQIWRGVAPETDSVYATLRP